MKGISDLFSGPHGGIIKNVTNTVDQFPLSIEDRQRFKIEMTGLLQKLESDIAETASLERQDKERIAVFDSGQGDVYTKRARPSLVYFGMAIITFNYCIAPFMQFVLGKDVKPFDLPEFFWLTWGGVVGTWSIGRSVEKLGVRSKLLSAVTGAVGGVLGSDTNSTKTNHSGGIG